MSITSIEDLKSSLKTEGAEAPIENKATEVPTTDEGVKKEESTTETPTNTPKAEVDIESAVNEKINQLKESGEFVDKSTFEQKLAEKELKNEFLKQLAELDGGKGKVTKDFLREYLKDYDNIDIKKTDNAIGIVKEKLMKSENFDSELAQMEIEDKYNLLFDEDADKESREYLRQKKLLERDAELFLKQKKEEQQSLALTDPSSPDLEETKKKIFEDFSKEQVAKQREIESAWKDYGTKLSNKIEKEVYEVDGHQFEITYTPEEKAQIADYVANAPKLIESFFDEVGGQKQLNEERFTKFVTKSKFFDKILESAVKDAIVIGEENRLKTTKNATGFKDSTPSNKTMTDKEVKDAMQKYGIAV
jgi:hypothetical protein